MQLKIFNELEFLPALKMLFLKLRVPINYVTDKPTSVQNILIDTYKDNESFNLINEVFFVGMVDDAAFEGNKSLEVNKIKSDYDGILIFGITLHERPNNYLPTRSQLAEISRAFNREFYYTPVVVIFKYKDNKSDYIAFANNERLKYKQEWREGEKAGKVSLLRDINIKNPHSGHERILRELEIPEKTGKNQIDNFEKLYLHWQEKFSVSVLNKEFYHELQNWYFWAIGQVTFPGKPTLTDAHNKNSKIEDLIQVHNATNIIRLLTRILFIWFIKEKGLIPNELFDLKSLQEDILNEISPFHDETLFKDSNKESIYYKAILQNLFFATLNCPIKPDTLDTRSRGFRGDGYGQNRGVDFMMRYKKYFKNPDLFLDLVNKKVPFLNGGLFECLDNKSENIYIDGFSDGMAKGEQLIVPDYLFFGIEEKVDLSNDYGISNKGTKGAAVKGLIKILESYKFTITENTPIEEDVALDPELLGKVFENLLASYNPETKTTARKQTGSFYTPREVVNYMVDESLIEYLKGAIVDWNISEEELNLQLQILTSFDHKIPFQNDISIKSKIISALDKCIILDPACGSGAFPMGILQKMVHILKKLDPNNEIWKEIQENKAKEEAQAAFEIQDKNDREERFVEINNAFDQNINDPDYARKLFLIENCIYGIDIQPIATQISKLRFFISLVVEQKVNIDKDNFGIRPLPNLETKFVAANTLLGIEKPKKQLSLYDTIEIRELETELKIIRGKLFSAKSKETKVKYRQKDEELRNKIADELKRNGWSNNTADKLAKWDPYDQNTSSIFFDKEWMFDIKDGFNIVIGNPPYINANDLKKKLGKTDYEDLKKGYDSARGTIDIYILFFEAGLKLLAEKGTLTYITPNRFLSASYGGALRSFIYNNYSITSISDLSSVKVFEAASTYPIVTVINEEKKSTNYINIKVFDKSYNIQKSWLADSIDLNLIEGKIWGFLLNSKIAIVKLMMEQSVSLSEICQINATSTAKEADDYHQFINEKEGHKLINTGTIDRYKNTWGKDYLTDQGQKYKYPHLQIISDHISSNRKKLYQSPKIILAKIAIRTEAFYDSKGEFASINTNCLYNFQNDYSPKYITCWLNSKLFQFVFNCYFDGLKMSGGYLLYSAPNIKSLFIKKAKADMQYLFDNLHDISAFQNDENSVVIIDQVIDGLFFENYFENHLKDIDLDIYRFVSEDISKILENGTFENLSDNEKFEAIKNLNILWSHPDNEVRNRIKLFAVRSPDILMPIIEN